LDSIASGTEDPSLCSSAPEIITDPPKPDALIGESVNTHPVSTVILPELIVIVDLATVPPEKVSSLPELAVTVTSTNELSIRETTPATVKLPLSI